MQVIEQCRYQLTCERADCHHIHDTPSGRSPEFLRCSYKLRCHRDNCKALLHNTLDCLPPQQKKKTFITSSNLDVKIMSWNILSEPLAMRMANHYPSHVMHDRWTRIASLLEKNMKKDDTIICLQEVALSLHPKLCALADHHGYRVIYDSWGNDFNDKMGNAILIPISSMTIVSKNRIRIGAEALLPTAKIFRQTITSLVLHHSLSNTRFIVATLHMPCRYMHPEVMNDLVQVVYRMMQVAHYPVLVAGDFNHSWADMPFSYKIQSIWQHRLPIATTHSKVREEQLEFMGCIDHILFTFEDWEFVCGNNNWRPADISKTLLPNFEHPSDHIPIYGHFRTKNKKDS